MGWAGRAPAPPAREAGKGRQTRGARHVSQGQFSNSRDRHRYRQELISRGWSGQARRDHASAEVVARTGGSTAGQLAALSNRLCVETRHMRAALKAQINKTDRNDARGMAQQSRIGTGYF